MVEDDDYPEEDDFFDDDELCVNCGPSFNTLPRALVLGVCHE